MTDMTKAEKKRKKDRGYRRQQLEDKPHLGEEGEVSQGGRKGGGLGRDIGTRDEEKRATERPASVTRVRKKDEKDD